MNVLAAVIMCGVVIAGGGARSSRSAGGRLTVKVAAQNPRLTWPWCFVLTHTNVL